MLEGDDVIRRVAYDEKVLVKEGFFDSGYGPGIDVSGKDPSGMW